MTESKSVICRGPQAKTWGDLKTSANSCTNISICMLHVIVLSSVNIHATTAPHCFNFEPLRLDEGCSFKWCPQVNKAEWGGPIYLQHSHSFKTLSSTLHTQFQSYAPRFKGILIVGWRQYGWSSELTAFARSWMQGNFGPANFSLMRGNNQKSHGGKLELQRGWARTWMFYPYGKVTVTLALWVLLSSKN